MDWIEGIGYVLDFRWAARLDGVQVRLCFLAFFVAVAVFALSQDRDYVYLGAPDRRRWRDLRLWALAILAVQAALYWAL